MKLFFALLFLAGLTIGVSASSHADEVADEINELPTANSDSLRLEGGNYSENPQKACPRYFAPGVAMDEFSKTSETSAGLSDTEEGTHK